MRIGTYTQINQLYNMSGTKKSNNVSSSGYASFQDAVSFSTNGKDMQIAKEALKQVSDVRSSLINDLKSKIQSGNYEVSGEDFATKLMDTFNNNTY